MERERGGGVEGREGRVMTTALPCPLQCTAMV